MKNILPITAVINTFNRQDILVNAYNSVVNQTSPVQEILIIDDGSTDDTEALSKNLIDNSQIKTVYIKNHSKGISSSRNTGIKNASYEHVALLDDDDVWCNDHIEKLRNIQEKHPDAALYGGRTARYVNNTINKDDLPEKLIQSYKIFDINSEKKFIRIQQKLISPFFTPHLSTCMVNKKAALKSPFDEDLKLRQDISFVWHIGQLGSIILDNDVHAIVGQYTSSLASSHESSSQSEKKAINSRRSCYGILLAEKAINKRSAKECPDLHNMLFSSYFTHAYNLIQEGKRSESFKYFTKSLRGKFSLNHLKLLTHIIIGR